MNFGKGLMLGALVCVLTALVSYIQTARGKEKWRNPARLAHIVMTLCLVGSVAWLMHLVVTHQFQYSYVYRYSSRDLPMHFLVSTFWAGQEGTFLLWAVYTSILGLFVIKTGKKFEAGVMSFTLLLETFLVLILVKLSPFALGPMTPQDGAGLNPLLQDYWMVIHPPMLFMGFASFTIPAAFAMHAMARGDTDEWVKPALPWTAFAVMVLGTAICLGGYWAYRTLGWGGYWGWDPVENSSFVPWLFGLALLHGLVVQRNRGSLKRSNLFLAVMAFMLVLYSTFLTRSGVLGDFSVHSFVDLGINGFLIAFVVVYGLIGFGLYAWRVRKIAPAPPAGSNGLSREYGMFLGSLAIALFALIVLFGTSAPLITRIGGKASNVANSYYHVTSVPFGILITSLLAIGPLLRWGAPRRDPLWRGLISPAVLGALATVLFYLLGVTKAQHLALVFTASAALFVNLEIVLGTMFRSPARIGGYLAHVGIGLMILGIITSTVYDRQETVVLPRGQMAEALGYKFVWTGDRKIEGGKQTAYDVAVFTPDNRNFTMSPVMFFSAYNNGVMRHPAIHRMLRADLYLSPQGIDRDEALDRMEHREMTLKKGETAMLGTTKVTFSGFERRSMTQEKIEIAAILDIDTGTRKETIKPVVMATGEGQIYEEAISAADGSKYVVRRVDPTEGRALFYVRQPGSAHYDLPIDALYLDVSLKPFILLLWIGTFCAIGGLLLTVIQRARQAGSRSSRSGVPVLVEAEPGEDVDSRPERTGTDPSLASEPAR